MRASPADRFWRLPLGRGAPRVCAAWHRAEPQPRAGSMYRHLLVPVEGTDFSVEGIGKAVALAHPLGARVTIFHAVTDAAGSLRGDAKVLRLTARDEYEYAHLGKAR